MKPRAPKTKLKSADALAAIVARAKRAGKKVVFTNGVFDILHPGHITYLHEARRQGDVLIVALNADASVKRLKGPTRPVNSLKERMLVMAGLESIDYVTSFRQDTPLKTILKIKPNVLVKGGDWKIDQIVGGREVQSWGGTVKSLTFVDGHSTTKIIGKILPISKKS